MEYTDPLATIHGVGTTTDTRTKEATTSAEFDHRWELPYFKRRWTVCLSREL